VLGRSWTSEATSIEPQDGRCASRASGASCLARQVSSHAPTPAGTRFVCGDQRQAATQRRNLAVFLSLAARQDSSSADSATASCGNTTVAAMTATTTHFLSMVASPFGGAGRLDPAPLSVPKCESHASSSGRGRHTGGKCAEREPISFAHRAILSVPSLRPPRAPMTARPEPAKGVVAGSTRTVVVDQPGRRPERAFLGPSSAPIWRSISAIVSS
jgi:hypothetical protein